MTNEDLMERIRQLEMVIYRMDCEVQILRSTIQRPVLSMETHRPGDLQVRTYPYEIKAGEL